MPCFPMFIALKECRILIVGGGAVALRKLHKLLPYGGKLTVIAPHILPQIEAQSNVKLRRRCFRAGDLRPRPTMVIAAADDGEVNREVAILCHKRHIPVNVADEPSLCTFFFPALVQQGEFSAGISTGGASPTAAAYFKEELRALLPENLDGLLSWLESMRPKLKNQIPEQSKRAAAFRSLFEACMAKGAPLTREETEACVAAAPMGSVALVGAGCGKADLITVRGLRLLRQCQAVVYDDLIDPALLEAVPESAQRLYMGKRCGAHAAAQEEINQTLITLARSGLRVVRLKGGDPYLFGRGGEEMQALLAAGIPCQEIPGIPSAIGIPAEAGIPVTHRGSSHGVHIITAHTADTPDGLPDDLDALAKLSGTLVFLMGLRQLPAIAARLMAAGKRGDTPAAVLSGGNAPHPMQVRAPLSQLAQKANAVGICPPAVIVIGDVASMELSAIAARLRGVRVGVTGTREVAEKQLTALRALGAEAEWVMRFGIKELPTVFDRQSLTDTPCWLVFTSANGVKTFFHRMEEQDIAPHRLEKHKFAVIGAATGAALAHYGLHAALCPKIATCEALAQALAAAAQPEEPIILLRSASGTPALPETLQKAGFTVRDIALYDMEAENGAVLPQMDYLTFSSAGGVKLFAERYGAIPKGTRCVCIGSVTAQALSQYTADAFLTASEISAAGIVEAIVKDCSPYGS